MFDLEEHEGLIRDVIRNLFGGIANAHKIAKTRGMSVEDLFQVGRIALWKASERHDATKGELSTYAYYCIKGSILNEINNSFPMKMPSAMSVEEKIANCKVDSLDQEINFEGVTMMDSLPSSEGPFEDSFLLRWELETKAEKLLTEREKLALYRSAYEGLTHQQIASQMGCTRRNVSITIKNAKNKLLKAIS